MVDALTLATVLNAGHGTASEKLVDPGFPLATGKEQQMGIDVYLKWEGQTEEEQKAQYTGFSIEHGHVGYLREAYHGGPYATKVLFPEGWSTDSNYEKDLGVPIKSGLLRERLPLVIKTAIERGNLVYKQKLDESSPEVKSFKDFVELAERIEAGGKQVYIEVSA